MWSLCSVDFHTLTLQLPIQTQNPVAPELQVFVSSLENCPNFSKTSTPLGVEYWIVSNETNTDVPMYIEEFISSRCSHNAVHVGTEDKEWNLHWFIYNRNNSKRKDEIALRCTIDILL